ncbi:ADO1 (YJR105W) [Zygosaccharomyces parabailii]|nr:ADO1 (YJR105W) [Zygosaccharomyces parabailii]
MATTMKSFLHVMKLGSAFVVKSEGKLTCSRIHTCTRSVERTIALNMTQSPELICLGNPLLDLQSNVEPSYLEKYDLKANDAILVDAASGDKRMTIFEEILGRPNVHLVAGGAAQNTARGAAYVLGKGHVGYFGSVGDDKYSEKLLAENEAAGVLSFYQVHKDIGTGKCAALITGHNRSLVTDLGAANHFKPEHLDKHWDKVEAAKLFYIGGFHLTVSPEAIVKLGKHAQQTGKPFVLNLSAPFIPQFFKSALEQVLPYTNYVIANESEAESYAKSFGLSCAHDDLESIAKHIVDSNTKRTVIFTHGLEPTVVVSTRGTKTYPVKPISNDKIVDTNGAGDAFAGGFVAGLAQNYDMDKSIDLGQWLAALSLQEIGPSYPKKKIEYKA